MIAHLRGHRQPFTEVRITEIAFDGQRFTAPELEAKPAKKAAPATPPAPEAADVTATPEPEAKIRATKHKAAAKTAAAKPHAGKPASKGKTAAKKTPKKKK